MTAYCFEDVLVIIDKGNTTFQDPECPMCRGEIRKIVEETSRWFLVKPLLTDIHWMEAVKYQCSDCMEEMLAEVAKTHRASKISDNPSATLTHGCKRPLREERSLVTREPRGHNPLLAGEIASSSTW